jgi:hypothetical protein
MKSTGEVLGIADSFGLAFWKAQEAVTPLPTGGTVLITVSERDRPAVIEVARQFASLGFLGLLFAMLLKRADVKEGGGLERAKT